MLKNKLYRYAILVLLPVLVFACATKAPEPTQKAPGFLADYSVLQPIPLNQDGVRAYMYKNPDVKRSDYHAIMVAPVALYQPVGESGIKVTNSQIEQTRAKLDSNIRMLAGQKLPVVETAGPGVAKLNVAITGAVLEGDGFKPRYIIPISAVIKMATMASGLDNKKPVLVVETKVTDSQSGKLLRASVTTISGDKFRQEASTPAEFEKLAQVWVEQAMGYLSQHN